MQQFGAELLEQVTLTYVVLLLAYLSLLVSWPAFLWLEKKLPVHRPTPRSNYILNWKITVSNLLLAPAFLALAVLSTLYLARATGLPSLSISTAPISVGVPLLDIILQGTVIFSRRFSLEIFPTTGGIARSTRSRFCGRYISCTTVKKT